MLGLATRRQHTLLVTFAACCVFIFIIYVYPPQILMSALNRDMRPPRTGGGAVMRGSGLDANGQKKPLCTLNKQALPKLHPSVNVVPSCYDQALPYHDCVPLPESPTPGAKICVYPSRDDIYVSAYLKKGTLFEANDVKRIVGQATGCNGDCLFLDFGANIGVYTMFAAASGLDVLAVEMLPQNVHQIQTSLQESGLSPRVTIINNALYDGHTSLEARFIKGNVGASHLNTSGTNFAHYNMEVVKNKAVSVKTVCIDDLIPLIATRYKKVVIKMDIERAEAKALTCATEFFATLDVKVLFMEWLAKEPADQNKIVEFMKKRGYVPSLEPTYVKNVNIKAYEGNLFFIREFRNT